MKRRTKSLAPDAPIRVLQLAESPYLGGITTHILSIAHAFRDDPGVSVHVACLAGRREDETLLTQAAAWDIPVTVLPMAHALDPGVLLRLRAYLRKERIDLIHTHNYRATILAWLAGGRPVLPTVHTAMAATGARLEFWQGLERRVLRRLPMVLAVSEATRRWLQGQGLSEEKIRVCYNACNVAEVPEVAVEKLRDQHAIPPEAVVVAYIGRLVADKGLEQLLVAVQGLPVHLMLVGDGPMRATLEAQRQALGLQAHFAGSVADPASYYALADVVALPSRMEALPMSLIEAGARGKAVVASMVGGIPEIVQEGKTGLLIPYGDAPMLREALEELLDTAVRARMGEAARRRWQAQFTPERLAENLAACYAERLSQ